jgi:hypothetical protein
MTTAEKLTTIAENEQKIFDKGKDDALQEKWNQHMEGLKNGKTYGFAGKGWTDKNFTPYTDINLSSGNAVSFFAYSGITNLSEIFNRYETKLVCSGVVNASNFFSYSLVTHVPELNFSKATTIQGMFSYADNLVTIDKLTFPENCTVTNAFQNCTSLKNISIGGKIGKSIDFHWSRLTRASVESIVTALSDTASGQTVTFNNAWIEQMDDGSWWGGQYAKATAKGWSVSLINIKNS